MTKEKLIPWTINNCDEETFVGMGWVDRKKGTFFLDWTRQGNTGWKPSDAARAWAKVKGHLKNKKPRDLKAGLRNAYRSKKNELVKVHIPKEIAEKNGKKRMIWRFLDLESELEKISNPSSKAKKSATTKNRRDKVEIVYEDSSPSCSSTISDCEYVFPTQKEKLTKGKISTKRGIRTKDSSKKQSRNSAISLPPIRSLIRKKSFSEIMSDTYTPPLQSQDISSTLTDARFPGNIPGCGSYISLKLPSYPNGPTPPPQNTDVIYNDPGEMNRIRASVKSNDCPSYYKSQTNLFLNQSYESRQSVHSISSLWNNPMPNQFQNCQVLSQSDESNPSPQPCSPCNSSSPNLFPNTQVFNQSDGCMNIPHSNSPSSSSQYLFQFTQEMNQPGASCDATTPSNAQHYFSPSQDQFQGSASQSQKISEEQICDNLQRIESPSLYSNVTFPDLIVEYSSPGSENQSLFPDFNLLEIPFLESSSQSKEATVDWGFEAPMGEEENFFDLSQLIISDFNLQ